MANNNQFNSGVANNVLQTAHRIKQTAIVGQVMAFTCPECGHRAGVRPKRQGTFLCNCPQCNAPIVYRVAAAGPAPSQPAPSVVPPQLGTPVFVKDNLYAISEMATVGQTVSIKCSRCGKTHVLTVNEPGRKAFTCHGCQCQIRFVVTDPNAPKPQVRVATTKRPVEQTTTLRVRAGGAEGMGALAYGGFLGRYRRKVVILKVGDNFVGRADASMPSDISFEDKNMSRRSVNICVTPNGNTFLFQLIVHNATNPVQVNKQTLKVGDSIYLNFGDVLHLGSTDMQFVKAPNNRPRR